MTKIKLGNKVKCKYTGMIGTATQRVKYLNRAEDQIGIQADSSADNGTLPALEYIQENWLKVVNNNKKKGLGHD